MGYKAVHQTTTTDITLTIPGDLYTRLSRVAMREYMPREEFIMKSLYAGIARAEELYLSRAVYPYLHAYEEDST